MFAQGQQNSHIIHMACDEMANKNKQMAFEKKKQQQPMRAQTKYADGWKKQKKKASSSMIWLLRNEIEVFKGSNEVEFS